MLNPMVINNLRAFLERTQLTGKEVPAFNQVMMALAVEENAGRPVVSLAQPAGEPPAGEKVG